MPPEKAVELYGQSIHYYDAGQERRFARVHATNLTPSVAVACTGLATAATALFGESILIPISEVGSMASAVGWLATCAAYFRLESARRERAIAAVGATVGLLLILMKVLPMVPGSFTAYEYLALALWILLGCAFKRRSFDRPFSAAR
jgi:amino acid transporter